MSRALALAAGLLFASCTQAIGPEAHAWTVKDFVDPAGRTSLAGWRPEQLAAHPGDALFHLEADAGTVVRKGVVVQPGYSEGVSAPFLITELWQDHPVPWVQPVWVPRRADGSRIASSVNVFSVDVDSTFYSPFWQLEVIASDALQEDNVGFRSAREVLALSDATTHTMGPLVFCPVVPEGVSLARTSAALLDPVTRAELPWDESSWVGQAWAEQRRISYFAVSTAGFAVSGQRPVAANAWFFVTAPGGDVLPLPAVLPPQPKTHVFVTRIDVTMPVAEPGDARVPGVYLPSDRPELRARLEALGLVVPLPSAANDLHVEHALKVTRDTRCFTSGDLATCEWLDRQAALTAGGLRLTAQPVQLSVGVLGP